MIYIGIDIAKLNHFAAAISSDSEILIELFKFTNDYDGFYLLLSKLAPLDQNSIIIGLESTAHYGGNLVRFLISKDIISKNQTAWIRKIIWIILYDFAGCNSIFYVGTTDISFLHSL